MVIYHGTIRKKVIFLRTKNYKPSFAPFTGTYFPCCNPTSLNHQKNNKSKTISVSFTEPLGSEVRNIQRQPKSLGSTARLTVDDWQVADRRADGRTCTKGVQPCELARKSGSMVRINGLFHLLITGVDWGYNPLILTFFLLPGTSK